MCKRLCCLLLLLALLPGAAALAVEPPAGYESVPVYLDGILRARGFARGEWVYVPLDAVCARMGLTPAWSGDTERFTLELGALKVEGEAGRQYYTADGRYVYAPEDWLVPEGALYLPEKALCKLLNLKARYEGGELWLDLSQARVLEGGEDYYELNFPLADVYWLSHIIASEAGIEPMEGKIGVGNVVMNRVKDPDFPDTVFEVVFDHSHTMQFEPVSKGTIHEQPKAEDFIAAYLVLEGADTAGDCLYFVNPDFGSFWFDNNLDFVIKLGRHNFYVSRETEDAGTDTQAGS